MAPKIHPTAIVHPSAQIADGVDIGPYVVIGEDVKIGEGTHVGPHCFFEFAEIGKNNYFSGGVYLGTPPQDFSYKNEKTKVVIGDNNYLREGVSIHRGTKATMLTSVGSNCMLMANSHIGHDGRVGNGVVMVNGTGLAGHVHVEDKVIISGLCGVHQFGRIGTMAMLSGGAMATMDIPPYCRAQGDRAKLVGLNIIGMRRNGISKESIMSVKAAYKVLFASGLPMQEAINRIKSGNFSPEAIKMAEFCAQTKRGVARPRLRRGKTADAGDDE